MEIGHRLDAVADFLNASDHSHPHFPGEDHAGTGMDYSSNHFHLMIDRLRDGGR